MSNAPPDEPASYATIDKIPTAIAMTENKPPAEAQVSAASNADQPGRPYYEQLRTTLRGTLDKKRKLDEQLAALEDQIFKLEGAYLEETSNSGNIVRGFDGWVKGVSVGGRAGDDRRRGRVRDEDRVFSHSSVGWMKVSMLRSLDDWSERA
jgi:chromatin modification-related protein EAF6